MKIFVIGLRRSGTTVFFDTFRQDRSLTCFDEPFNAMIRDIPDRDEWGSKKEYVDLYHKDPAQFWTKYAYILGIDELRPNLTPDQVGWLDYMLASAPRCFADFTRLNFKLAALNAIVPDAVLVHLHRQPASFASSHLLPSVWQNGRWFKYTRKKLQFWKTYKKFDFWGLETIIGRSPRSMCGHMFRAHGFDSDAIYASNAATKLCAFWKTAFDAASKDGQRLYGDRYVQIPFERFTQAPEAYIAEIYKRAGAEAPRLDLSAIRPATGNPFVGHAGWRAIENLLGFDPEQIEFDGDLIL